MATLPDPEPELPETRERRCPSCGGAQIVHAGHVVAGEGTIRAEHRCERCGIAFWFVRVRMPTRIIE
jgi:ribosomal protein S14